MYNHIGCSIWLNICYRLNLLRQRSDSICNFQVHRDRYRSWYGEHAVITEDERVVGYDWWDASMLRIQHKWRDADANNPLLGESYSRSREQCGGSRVVEALGWGVSHRVNIWVIVTMMELVHRHGFFVKVDYRKKWSIFLCFTSCAAVPTPPLVRWRLARCFFSSILRTTNAKPGMIVRSIFLRVVSGVISMVM